MGENLHNNLMMMMMMMMDDDDDDVCDCICCFMLVLRTASFVELLRIGSSYR